jgi:organic radical activating enzyme
MYKPYYLNHVILWYIIRFLKPKPVPQVTEKESFKDLNTVWSPNGDKSRIFLKWFNTEWCNYNCTYCFQNHSRNRRNGSRSAHSFDNYSPVRWVDAIDRAFKMKEMAISITGGEPMLDMENMSRFLKMMLNKTHVDNIRITSNMSWNPSSLKDLPNKEKLIFYLTFHPSQVRFDDFINKAKLLKELGFSIGLVNYVMTTQQSLYFEELKNKFKEANLPLHPVPLWYSKADNQLKEILIQLLESADVNALMGNVTKGKICYFPSIGYEMDQNGNINVGCFPWVYGNIFKNEIPNLPEGPVKCPRYQCRCFDKYSFIKGFNRNIDLNLLKIYGNLLRKRLNLQTL